MANLMYNPSTDIITDRSALDLLETPEARGRFHQPYPFSTFVDQVEHGLENNGLQIVTEEYAITKDNNRMFGMMEIAPLEGELIKADDWRLTLGLRGSHDERIPRGIALGSQVMVCSNLCFSGDLGTFKTKQTLNIATRLPALIDSAMARIPQLAEMQERKFDAYKNKVIKHWAGDAALVELVRRGGLTSAQLGKALQEWDNPSHEEHAQYGKNTVWNLFNACTEALKPTGTVVNMNTVQDRSQRVESYINGIVGI